MVIKLRSRPNGIHVHTTVFMGPENQTLQNCGELIQSIGQWQLFGAALLLGTDRMQGKVKVICEGDEEVVEYFS